MSVIEQTCFIPVINIVTIITVSSTFFRANHSVNKGLEFMNVPIPEAEPNVAAREISEDDELKRIAPMPKTPGPPPFGPPPGSRCRGRALPELCLDLIMGTGVLLGEMKGLADGLWGHEP